jgi:hypothetical protein
MERSVGRARSTARGRAQASSQAPSLSLPLASMASSHSATMESVICHEKIPVT